MRPNTYILRTGRLVEMPDGLMFMVPTKIFRWVLAAFFLGDEAAHGTANYFTAAAA